MDVLSISVRTGVMTALEHLSSLVERSINHKDLSLYGTSNISDGNSSGKTG